MWRIAARIKKPAALQPVLTGNHRDNDQRPKSFPTTSP
jgi:hypothetical protein